MGLARKFQLWEQTDACYHVWIECASHRRLGGTDERGRNQNHRKSWVEKRLAFLTSQFAVEVPEYAVMDTHFHGIIVTRPSLVEQWSDEEVAIRWELIQFGVPTSPGKAAEAVRHIQKTLSDPERVKEIRGRLGSLSWFMRKLDEWLAQRANEEDESTGHFWADRFRSRPLKDEKDRIEAMEYVALNPVRAGMSPLPEEGPGTGFQLRAEAWVASRILERLKAIPEETMVLPSEALIQAAPGGLSTRRVAGEAFGCGDGPRECLETNGAGGEPVPDERQAPDPVSACPPDPAACPAPVPGLTTDQGPEPAPDSVSSLAPISVPTLAANSVPNSAPAPAPEPDRDIAPAPASDPTPAPHVPAKGWGRAHRWHFRLPRLVSHVALGSEPKAGARLTRTQLEETARQALRRAGWLLPLPVPAGPGPLSMTDMRVETASFFLRVDRRGRLKHPAKPGSIAQEALPIPDRLEAVAGQWLRAAMSASLERFGTRRTACG